MSIKGAKAKATEMEKKVVDAERELGKVETHTAEAKRI